MRVARGATSVLFEGGREGDGSEGGRGRRGLVSSVVIL